VGGDGVSQIRDELSRPELLAFVQRLAGEPETVER
jgi:hypothetical protein